MHVPRPAELTIDELVGHGREAVRVRPGNMRPLRQIETLQLGVVLDVDAGRAARLELDHRRSGACNVLFERLLAFGRKVSASTTF